MRIRKKKWARPELAACPFYVHEPKTAANLLFTTKTCPNCKIAKALLEKAGIAYENIYANENEDMAVAYDIVTAPTLVVPEGDGVRRLKGVSEIRKYIESL